MPPKHFVSYPVPLTGSPGVGGEDQSHWNCQAPAPGLSSLLNVCGRFSRDQGGWLSGHQLSRELAFSPAFQGSFWPSSF